MAAEDANFCLHWGFDMSAIRDAISQSIESTLADTNGRLLALRITLIGDSSLHNQLHAEQAQWQAECVNLAAEIDEELIWFERLRIKTNPTYDPHELADRDALTKLVLDALDQFDPISQPAPVSELTAKLKDVDSKELQQLLSASDNHQQLKQDVAAIVLRSISTSAR